MVPSMDLLTMVPSCVCHILKTREILRNALQDTTLHKHSATHKNIHQHAFVEMCVLLCVLCVSVWFCVARNVSVRAFVFLCVSVSFCMVCCVSVCCWVFMCVSVCVCVCVFLCVLVFLCGAA
jgi:hypothetical protein